MTTPEPDPARRARDEFADTGVVPSSSAAATAGERAGDVIDRYKLLQEIGEGGMGTVWMAEQKEPVRRQVALKIIKLGMDTKEVVVRFEAERQALALMDHPNIAKVLDGGATAQGRPFFVMELVRGVPITQYCDEQKLGIRARLELFTKVCEAIQHAHHKGVIHRDIKPSNVMVTLHDGTPVPKVIDFGIAKATSVELTQKTLFTQYGNMIGTPEYMAPEQAAMSGLDIDTRADVYSLGVLLYELLTGSKPFDITKVLEKGYAELLRTIREDDPAKPSTRVSTMGDKTPLSLSHANVGKLSSRLRGDLDWIVMRALEKDRTRRYETANGFAADVSRYLNGEPVHAAPPSSLYKLRKFVARRKRTVALLAVIIVLLVGGSVGTALGWLEAKTANTRLAAEVVAKEQQRELAETAKVEAQTQQQRAEQQEAEAKKQETLAREQETEAKKQAAIAEAVAKFQTDMLGAVDPSQLPIDPVTKEPLKDALTVVQAMAAAVRVLDEGSLRDQPLVEARVRSTIGKTLQALGRFEQAESNLRQALSLCRTALPAGDAGIARAMANLAVLLTEQNELAEAEALYREVLEIDRVANPLAVAIDLSNLGDVLRCQDELTEAEQLFRQSLAIHRASAPADPDALAGVQNNLALLLQQQNRLDEAEQLYRDVLDSRRASMPAGHPFLAESMNNLGWLLSQRGKPDESEALLRDSLSIYRATLPAQHLKLALALNNLAVHLSSQKRWDEVEPLLREALTIVRASLPQGHPNIAVPLNGLATALQAKGELEEAEQLFREALEVARKGYPEGNENITTMLSNLALILNARNGPAAAEPLLREVLQDLRATLPAGHPNIASSMLNLGACLREQGKLAEAEPLLRDALALRRGIAPSRPLLIAESLNQLGLALKRRRKSKEAESVFREALEMLRTALPTGHQDLAFTLTSLGLMLDQRGAHAEAEPFLRESLEIKRQALPVGAPLLTDHLKDLALNLQKQEKFAEAEPLLVEALESLRATVPVEHPHRIFILTRLGEVYNAQGKTDEALPIRRELLDALRPNMGKNSRQFAGALARMGMEFLERDDWAEAEPLLRESLTLREQAEPDAWTTFNSRSMLGAAWLGQGRLDEAEPLLLEGYRGMKEREAKMPPEAEARIVEALERLVKLYEAKGDEAEAAAWRSKLEAARSSGADK